MKSPAERSTHAGSRIRAVPMAGYTYVLRTHLDSRCTKEAQNNRAVMSCRGFLDWPADCKSGSRWYRQAAG